MKKVWVVILLSLLYVPIQAIVVGSYNTVSRQGQVIFPSTDTDNQIVGFTFMEEGFIFEDGKTTCSFNNLFGFSGDMFFNSGIIYLIHDFQINQGARGFSPPVIYGDSRKVMLPFVQNTAVIPASFYPNFVSGLSVDNTIISLDWDNTSKWIALALSTGTSDEIQLIYFDGTTPINRFALDTDDSVDPLTLLLLGNTTINVIRWNPIVSILAVGANPGASDELLIYGFDDTATTLTEADTTAIGDSVTALSWHPTGTWLAIGTANTTDEVRIFNFDSGTNTISSLDTNDLSPNRTISKDAISWDSTGNYLAVGTSSNGSADELLIYYFDESTITVTASIDVGATVSALDWHPSLSLLAVGLSEGLQRTRIYNFNSSTATLTELTSARTNEIFAVNSLEWHKDGLILLVNKEPNVGFETQLYIYNPITQTLTLYNQAKQVDTINDARWASSGLFFAQGGDANSLYIHNSDIAVTKLIDVNLLIRSKLTFLGGVLLKGVTSIDAGNNQIDISNANKVLLGSNSIVLFQNTILKGVSDDTFCLEDDTVKIILDNTTLLLDGTFTVSVGSIEFKNNVTIGGNGTFVYQTAHTSTINIHSILTLDEGITFSYDPIFNSSQNLIELTDDTSTLNLHGGVLHATLAGLNIKKGILRISDNSELQSEKSDISDEGINIGASNSSDDTMLLVDNSVTLKLLEGSLNYRNINVTSLKMRNNKSILEFSSGTRFNVFESINLGIGGLVFNDNTILGKAVGKTVTGSIYPLGTLFRVDFNS